MNKRIRTLKTLPFNPINLNGSWSPLPQAGGLTLQSFWANFFPVAQNESRLALSGKTLCHPKAS